MDTIKELLRALVLTYEDPAEDELLVLAGLSSDDVENKDELRRMVEKCKPLLTRNKLGDKHKISFVNADVKKHLQRSLQKLLDLPDEDVRLQHGILALRCFSHIMDTLTNVVEDPEPSSIINPEIQQPVSSSIKTAEDASDDMDADSTDHDSEDADSNRAPQAPGTAPSPSILQYATKYWLRHASEATLDIAAQLSQEKAFWESGSKIRYLWLAEFERLTNSFAGLNADESLKALHVAATVGFPRLVESLIKAGYGKEVNEYDSLENTPVRALPTRSLC